MDLKVKDESKRVFVGLTSDVIEIQKQIDDVSDAGTKCFVVFFFFFFRFVDFFSKGAERFQLFLVPLEITLMEKQCFILSMSVMNRWL